MKLSKAEITKLLENSLSKDPLMLHGTNIEAIQILFETGTLPPGKKNLLHFVPVQKKFKGTKFYKKFPGFTVKYVKEMIKLYAGASASDWYTTHEIAKVVSKPIYAEKIMGRFVYGFDGRFPDYRVPKKEIQKALKLDFEKIYSDAEKRKGVVLAVNEKILEYKFEIDLTEEGLKTPCPKGLDAKYIHGIKPLGKLEKDVIKKYL